LEKSKDLMMKEVEKMKKNNETTVWENETLKAVLKDIEKTFGQRAIIRLDEQVAHNKIEVINSGSLLINNAIGIGGYPKGRISEIFGPESSGKTTLSLHAIAEAQKAGGIAAFIDAEHALDPKYAANIGVDIKNLLVSQPESGEQALDILELLVKSEVIDLVIIDSVAALVPKTELDGEMGDQTIGLHARLMSKALRKLNGIISKTNTTVIFINQVREKVGVVYGNPEITTGGRALRFYASVRLETRKGETILKDGEAVGNKVKIKVVKNKVAPQFRSTIVTLNYNQGLDMLGEIIEMATIYNIFAKSGVWYSYKNEKIGQGREQVKQWLTKNLPLQEEIINLLNSKMNY